MNTEQDPELVRLVYGFENARKLDDLRTWFRPFMDCQGVIMLSYHHLPPPGASDYNPVIDVFARGFPEDWVEQYREERLFEHDPIPRLALSGATPFWWYQVEQVATLSQAEKDYLAKLKAANFGDGLAVPVFGPHGRNGYVGVGFGNARPDFTLYELARIQWVCQFSHLRYCQILHGPAEDDVSLSPREAEILHWVAQGKSNTVIADIIGISAYTVDTHMRRIFLKLGVADRVTAALRGMALGVLT